MFTFIIRGVLFLLASAGVVATAAIVAVLVGGFFFLFRGSSFEGCALGPGQQPTTELPQRTLVEMFETRWAELQTLLSGGSAATVSYSNAEATARARSYLDQRTDRIDDLIVCFEPGKARAGGSLKGVLGRDIGVVAEGTMDFSGEYPEVRLTHVRTGVVPLPPPLRSRVEDMVNRELRDLGLRHSFDATFDYNKMTVTASP